MKTILVDCINALVDKDTWIFEDMYNLLESYKNNKIILTSANLEQQEKFWLTNLPYDLFSLHHNPEKQDSEYYKRFLEKFELTANDVVYFEHNKDACMSAESIWIQTYFYDHNEKDLGALKFFLDNNL